MKKQKLFKKKEYRFSYYILKLISPKYICKNRNYAEIFSVCNYRNELLLYSLFSINIQSYIFYFLTSDQKFDH
jgi:hypothetical protein